MSTTRRQFVSTAAMATAGTAFGQILTSERGLAAAASTPSGLNASGDRLTWSIVPFGKNSVGGELAKRTEQNWQRLQHPAYSVPGIFANECIESWPGDWVGRTLLGKILLARSTGRDPHVATQIVKAMPAYLNREGYFGAVIDPELLNEQQLGDSHSWIFRALYHYHKWTGNPAAREMLDNIVHKIALPMTQWWDSYPITPDAREKGKGGVNGNGQWRYGRWFLSSDVGNQFMLLDGLTQAWELNRSAALKASIDKGIERFLKIDLIELQVQTHATLMTSRALLRMYALTDEKRLLQAVQERYDLYRQVAMTENYANYNWFDRPDTWTGPCGSIDSFIVAMQLWQFTGEPKYLEDAHLIWFNGVAHGQRSTGGFGCDSCAGVGNPFLDMKMEYEAVYCCTMRGAEGLSYAIQSAYHTRSGEVAVTFYTDSKTELDMGGARLALEQSTQYPYSADVQFKVTFSSVEKPLLLRLFAPSWITAPKLKLNGRRLEFRRERGFLAAKFTPRSGDVVALEGELKNEARPTFNPHSIKGYHAFHAGPLMLGYQGTKEIFLPETAQLSVCAPGQLQVKGMDVVLARINDMNELPLPSWDRLEHSPLLSADMEKLNRMSEKTLKEYPSSRRQMLFRKA